MKTKKITLGEREVEIRKLSIRQLRESAERLAAIPGDASADLVHDEWVRMIGAAVEAAGGKIAPGELLDLALEDVIFAYADVMEWSRMVQRPGKAESP